MIGQALQDGLKEASYATDWIKNGEAALNILATQHYDIILLDLGLPGKDGMSILKSIRSKDNPIPIIIITARDDVKDRITGLDEGADHYVLKPFLISELLARIRAAMRRSTDKASPLLTNGTLSLDLANHKVMLEGQNAIMLSNREFSLLEALMIRPGAILSRSHLEDRIYAWGEEVESNAIEVLIHSLRKKLGHDAIKNVRGVGWMVSKKE